MSTSKATFLKAAILSAPIPEHDAFGYSQTLLSRRSCVPWTFRHHEYVIDAVGWST
eukprot:CAMPEP_0196658850 /NCGR_PEP_ID=MMETSP1086-20130531/31954_1 /TAXON_ID=77921 /ORGANISM="Cyanoptyche  gloeocystis , Strain SAG4.97" /LENGTH=55 /DNA_ID=CAMNT_0041992613 /DNA_START=81 /DNA_END=244 /DNA_ORIENTATION=+